MLNKHLSRQIDSYLNLNLSRLKCLTLLIASLLRQRTVNLTFLATENLTGAKNESCYRRFQRFFRSCLLPQQQVARLILSKIPKPSKGWVLSVDRTNWKYGKCHINILTIGVVVNKVAIPIAWKVLPQTSKRGNSNAAQRMALFEKVLRLMDATEICALTMDREFGGKKWLKYLERQGVGYVVRIKKNILINGKAAFRHAITGKGKKPSRRSVMGMDLYFSNKVIQSKGRRDSHLYVVSNRFSGREALALYRQRWGIEQLFSHLKKRGFDLEATQMTEAHKLEKLFAIVSLALLFSYGWGCQIRKSQTETAATKRKSTFRLGLENILRLLSNPHLKKKERLDFIAWLNRPIYDAIFVV